MWEIKACSHPCPAPSTQPRLNPQRNHHEPFFCCLSRTFCVEAAGLQWLRDWGLKQPTLSSVTLGISLTLCLSAYHHRTHPPAWLQTPEELLYCCFLNINCLAQGEHVQCLQALKRQKGISLRLSHFFPSAPEWWGRKAGPREALPLARERGRCLKTLQSESFRRLAPPAETVPCQAQSRESWVQTTNGEPQDGKAPPGLSWSWGDNREEWAAFPVPCRQDRDCKISWGGKPSFPPWLTVCVCLGGGKLAGRSGKGLFLLFQALWE